MVKQLKSCLTALLSAAETSLCTGRKQTCQEKKTEEKGKSHNIFYLCTTLCSCNAEISLLLSTSEQQYLKHFLYYLTVSEGTKNVFK